MPHSLRILFVLLGVNLCSCSDGKKAPSAEKKDTKDEAVLRLITWEDYVSPFVIESFTEKTGIQVKVETSESADALHKILETYDQRFDLVIFDDGSASRFIENDLLQPVDRERLSGFGNLDPRFLKSVNDPENAHTVPYLWGTTLVAYRKDKIPNPKKSFSLLFDVSVNDRAMLLNEMFDCVAMCNLIAGRPVTTYNDAAIDDALAKMNIGIQDNGLQFGSDSTVRDALRAGKIWVGLAYCGDAAKLANENPNVGYFLPEEGAPLWLDVMAIPKHSLHSDEAYAFIDHLLQAEVAAANANFLHFATPNREALPFLNKSLLEDNAIYPSEEIMAKCDFFAPTSPETIEKVTSLEAKLLAKKKEVAGIPNLR